MLRPTLQRNTGRTAHRTHPDIASHVTVSSHSSRTHNSRSGQPRTAPAAMNVGLLRTLDRRCHEMWSDLTPCKQDCGARAHQHGGRKAAHSAPVSREEAVSSLATQSEKARLRRVECSAAPPPVPTSAMALLVRRLNAPLPSRKRAPRRIICCWWPPVPRASLNGRARALHSEARGGKEAHAAPTPHALRSPRFPVRSEGLLWFSMRLVP
mmetsp:Transcript_109574/g.266365  ORF Transcript_109574/g.266365 Transcript_109574/m.266365 type:complete len:210 (-) Transcript_109574:350-979(-)